MEVKTFPQSKLSAECWSVQMWGTDHCKECEFYGTEDCGGTEILKTGKNENGVEVGKKGMVLG